MLWLRLKQCFRPFTMLSLERSSETRLFRKLSNHHFLESVISEIHQLGGSSFFKDVQYLIYISKIHRQIQKTSAVSEISASQLVALGSLLRRQCLPWTVNVLTNSLKTFYVIKREPSQWPMNMVMVLSFRLQ